MPSAWPPRRPLPCPRGAGCGRIWASWPSRCPRARSACRSSNHGARNGPGNSNGPTRPCPIADGALSMSTAGANAVASSKTGSGCGRRASAMSCWTSAGPCTTSECASRPGNRWFNRDKLNHTPKHGSWFNMAETALRVLATPCLDRRMPDQEPLPREVAAWDRQRPPAKCRIDWPFTTQDARIKLKRLYPSIELG